MRGSNVLPTLAAALVMIAVVPAGARGQQTEPANGSAPDSAPSETRALALTAEREAKHTTIEPPQRSFLERKLYWYDNQHLLDKVFAGWHGVHLAGGDFPAGAGTKYGVGFDPLRLADARSGQGDDARNNRVDISMLAARSTRGYTRASGTVTLRPVPAPIELSVGAQKYEFPEEDFFGFGSSSLEGDRTNYFLESTEAGGDLRWRPRPALQLAAGVWRVQPETGDGTDPRFPSSGSRYDSASLPGYGIGTDFLRTDVSATLDLRDNGSHPHAGGKYAVRLASYQPRDDQSFEFRRVEVELQHYVPLPNRYRTLALRAAGVFTDPGAGNDVPFYFQPTLGGAQALRGFREFRFRDRHSLLLSAEYRWEAWWALDGAFFVDVGEVASSRRGFTLDAVETSYGVGFRLHSNKAFVSRLDLAFSREGFIPLLRFEHAF